MKYFLLILVALFACFAYLQFNDPDPVIWIAIYGAMSVVCLLAYTGRYYRPVLLVQAGGYLVYLALLLPGFSEWLATPQPSLIFDDLAKMEHLYIEEAREFLGLVICLAVLTMLWLRTPKKS